MIRRPPRSTLFPTRRSSDLSSGRSWSAASSSCFASTRRPASKASRPRDRKSTRLNSSHVEISYAVFCLKKKKKKKHHVIHSRQQNDRKRLMLPTQNHKALDW